MASAEARPATAVTVTELTSEPGKPIRLITPPGRWTFSSLSSGARLLAARRAGGGPAAVVWDRRLPDTPALSVRMPEKPDGLERASHGPPAAASNVSQLVLSPDGEWLAGRIDPSGKGSLDAGPTLLWRTSQLFEPPRELLTAPPPVEESGDGNDLSRREMARLSFSSDSRWLVVLTPTHQVRFWDTRSELRAPLNPPWIRAMRVWSLAWSHDGRLAIAASGWWGGGLLLVDMPNEIEMLHEEPGNGGTATALGNGDTVTALAFDHAGQRLAAAAADGTIRVWRLETQRSTQRATWKVPVELRGAAHGGLQPRALAFSPGGERLAVALHDRLRPESARVAVYWLATGKLIELAEGLSSPSPDPSYLDALGLAATEKKTPPWPFSWPDRVAESEDRSR